MLERQLPSTDSRVPRQGVRPVLFVFLIVKITPFQYSERIRVEKVLRRKNVVIFFLIVFFFFIVKITPFQHSERIQVKKC